MTTSKRISLLFAWYVTIVVIAFGVMVNIAFFISWYRLIAQSPVVKSRPNLSQQYKIQNPQWFDRLSRRPLMTMTQPLILVDEKIIQELRESEKFISLISYKDQLRHYRIQDNRAILTLVDPLVDSQLILIYITLISAMILALLSYRVSIIIVRRGLQPLYLLADHVHYIQDPMDYEHLLVWPPQDELQQVSDSLTHAMSTIADQNRSLKQFVTHASHELKTPLMMISSNIDLMRKTGIDTLQTQSIKNTIIGMKTLIDRLMLTMRHDTLQSQKIDITRLISKIIDHCDELYPAIQHMTKSDIADNISKKSDPVACESIITNLIQNAYKYTQLGHEIVISADAKHFIVSNHVDPNSAIDTQLIWQPFYQANESQTDTNSHGLWLAIVWQMIERLWRTINVTLSNNIITFTVDWS